MLLLVLLLLLLLLRPAPLHYVHTDNMTITDSLNNVHSG
jgi:hypothetical protein